MSESNRRLATYKVATLASELIRQGRRAFLAPASGLMTTICAYRTVVKSDVEDLALDAL